MSEFKDMVAEITKIAERHDSYAYRFCYPSDFPELSEFDSPLVEIRCWPGNRRHELTACDRAGNHLEPGQSGTPDDAPQISGRGVSQPAPTIREEIRAEERGEEPEPQPKPKKKWWK